MLGENDLFYCAILINVNGLLHVGRRLKAKAFFSCHQDGHIHGCMAQQKTAFSEKHLRSQRRALWLRCRRACREHTEMTSRKSSLRARNHKGISMSFSGISRGLSISGSSSKKIQVGSEEFNERQVQEISDRLCSRSMWMLKWNEIIVSIIFNNIEVEHCCGNLPPQSHATSERFGAQCFNDVAAGLPWISSMSGAGGIHEGLLKLIPQVVFWADLAPKKYNTCNVSTGPIPECPCWIQFLGHPSLYVFGSLAENTQQNQQLLPSQV